MTKFRAIGRCQDRHKLVVSRLKQRIGVYIQYCHIKGKLAAQGFQRGEHVIAKMAINTAVERQRRPTCHQQP